MTDPLANCLPGGPVPTTPPPTPLDEFFFFFAKAEITRKKLVLKRYVICLKMLEMANSETQIFKDFWGSMTPDPSRKFAPSALHGYNYKTNKTKILMN